MSSTAPTPGSATRWGPLWGSRAEDWAATEEQQHPSYEEAIRRVGLSSGQEVLDVGCGTGVFLRAAADRGALVSGLDASEALIEIARRRVPDADLRVADLQRLPWDDDRFDVVAGFNSGPSRRPPGSRDQGAAWSSRHGAIPPTATSRR